MKFEASPSIIKWIFYEGGDFGLKLSPFLNYRMNDQWDLRVKYDFLTADEMTDNIFSAGTTFKGVKNMALAADISATPDPEMTEALKLAGQANYSIKQEYRGRTCN